MHHGIIVINIHFSFWGSFQINGNMKYNKTILVNTCLNTVIGLFGVNLKYDKIISSPYENYATCNDSFQHLGEPVFK